ncbi:MAG: hypothetical protein M1833_001855 [Piccolia ochrophora]|nr:MAG: hypothetical protein M1833_001855 [Piccolia ochrophora]
MSLAFGRFKGLSPKGLSYTIIFCSLLSLPFIAVLTLVSAVYVLSSPVADQNIMKSEILYIVCSGLSFVYTVMHGIAISRSIRSQDDRLAQKKLGSACFVLLQLLMTLWFVATVAGMLIATRRPSCLDAREGEGSIQLVSSSGCMLQRAGTGASTVALILSLALFWAMVVSRTPFARPWARRISVIYPDMSDHRPPSVVIQDLLDNPSPQPFPLSSENLIAHEEQSQQQLQPQPLTSSERSPSWGSGWRHLISPSTSTSSSTPHTPLIYSPTSQRVTSVSFLRAPSPPPHRTPLPSLTFPLSKKPSRPAPTPTITPHPSPSLSRPSPLSTMRTASNPHVPIISTPSPRAFPRKPLPESWCHPSSLIAGEGAADVSGLRLEELLTAEIKCGKRDDGDLEDGEERRENGRREISCRRWRKKGIARSGAVVGRKSAAKGGWAVDSEGVYWVS